MLKIGDKVKNFSCKDDSGSIISLSDYKGKKLVVFFYPKANTPGCTAEACSIRDNYKEISDRGYSILGVSADEEKKQKSFFPLYKQSKHLLLHVYKNQL